MKLNKILFVLLALCTIMSAFSQGNWELLHPHLTSNQLVSVDFIDADNGLAVGEIGTILKTTDGGATWQEGANPWSADLMDVDFVTEKVAFAVGQSGIILKTDIGGEFWVRQEIEFTNTLNRVRFYDENIGWIIGDGGLILRTIDGGKTWTRIITEYNYNWNGIEFTDRNTWILVGPPSLVLRTTDSGQTWTRLSIQGPDDFDETAFIPQDVFFLNSNVGWMAGKYVPDIDKNTKSILCKTTDGGANWQTVSIWGTSYSLLDSRGSGSSSGVYGNFPGIQQIYFHDEANGVCLSGPHYVSTQTTRSNILFHTKDGGENWAGQMETNLVTTPSKGRFCFLTPENGICTHPDGGFVSTNDSGSSWQPDGFWNKAPGQLVIGNDGVLTAFGSGLDVTGAVLEPREPGEIMYLGYRSTDYGKTWLDCQLHIFDRNGQVMNEIGIPNRFVSFREQDTVWGFDYLDDSTSAVYETADDGLNWHYVKDVCSDTRLKGVYVNADTLIQCGFITKTTENTQKYTFTVFVSYDGGQHAEVYPFPDIWNEITTTCNSRICYYENRMSGSHFFNSRKALVVGSDGNIIMTMDGGHSWQNIPSGVSDNLQDICFVNDQTGFIGGNFGRILKTDNGGLTWRKTNSGTQKNVYSLIFEDELTGWAGTSRGLLYTIDGGETWTSVTGQKLNGMIGYLEYDKAGNLYGYTMPGEGLSGSNRFIFDRDEQRPSGIFCVKKATTSQVADWNEAKPKQLKLYPNYPNPFNSNTMIQFDLAHASEIELTIYNIQGKRVRNLESGTHSAGSHTVRWDGRDQQGQAVCSGVYVVQLNSAGAQQSRKTLYLR